MAIVCLDTNILIWGVRKKATHGQEKNIERAMDLLSLLELRKDKVMTTSLCVAEAAVGVAQERLPAFIDAVNHCLMVVPFDNLAVTYYHYIYNKYKETAPQLKGEEYKRINVISDMKIAAAAVSHGAQIIYSNNCRDFNKIAFGLFTVEDMPPPIPKQLNLLQ